MVRTPRPARWPKCVSNRLRDRPRPRWPADAAPPFRVDQQAAPDIAWVAWLGVAVSPESSPARPYYLRAPDAKPPKDPLSAAAQLPASR